MLFPVGDIKPDKFTYELPGDRVAGYPVGQRDESRLLIRYPNGQLKEDVFKNIAGYLPAGSSIFFNNSKVIQARLYFMTSSGAKVEIFCLSPLDPPEYAGALSSNAACTWECMVGNARRFKERDLYLNIHVGNRVLVLKAEKLRSEGHAALIKFQWDDPHTSFAEILSVAGLTPLPPYIKREPEPEDRTRYQTVYSKIEGSVAAPTAGLHFTQEVLEQLSERRITRHEITLHVGAGTFQPVKTRFVKDHKMHAEFFEVSKSMVQRLADCKSSITCVGTTTVRTLESLYWIGARLAKDEEFPDVLHLNQWEPYTLERCPVEDAFGAICRWLERKKSECVLASTSLMIVPGYKFIVTERLITNFHQPGSSLLMLIAALIGDSWKEVYNYALDNGFRFLSYGDSSLLFNPGLSE